MLEPKNYELWTGTLHLIIREHFYVALRIH